MRNINTVIKEANDRIERKFPKALDLKNRVERIVETLCSLGVTKRYYITVIEPEKIELLHRRLSSKDITLYLNDGKLCI